MMGWLSLTDRLQSTPAPTNIWSLRKDKQLKHLLLILIERLGQTHWFVDQDIQMSYEAAYLVSREDRQLRAYLHIHGQSRGRAGLHLEYPLTEGAPPSYDAYDNLTVSQLEDMLCAHFGIHYMAGDQRLKRQ